MRVADEDAVHVDAGVGPEHVHDRVPVEQVDVVKAEEKVRKILANSVQLRFSGEPFVQVDAVPDDKPDDEMIKLARMLIDRQTAKFDPADMEDRYESRLRAVIEAKIKGVQPKDAEKDAPAGNVVDLMAALKRSLGQEPGSAAKPASKPAANTVAEPKTRRTRKSAG